MVIGHWSLVIMLILGLVGGVASGKSFVAECFRQLGAAVLDAACDALHVEDLDGHFLQVRRSVGPPWGKDHKVAMAAAIVAAAREIRS